MMTLTGRSWHRRWMSETKTNRHSYTLDVTPDPRTEGAWQWSIRYHGKLVQRSDRKLASEAKARAQGMERIEKLIHSAANEQR